MKVGILAHGSVRVSLPVDIAGACVRAPARQSRSKNHLSFIGGKAAATATRLSAISPGCSRPPHRRPR